MTDMQTQRAFDSTRNLFLTGPAGTGKSYALSDYIGSHENVLVCAPTGIAALHIGGDTMHRLFHIPVPAYETPSFAKDNKKAVPMSTLRTLAMADTVVIDEVSMARSDVFRYAIKVIRKAEKLKGGRIRVIVSGDFSQLPPVLRKGDDKLLRKCGLDPSGFAFTTQEWKSLNFRVLEFTDVRRQSDEEFIRNLNAIRTGVFTNLSYFDRFVGGTEGFEDAICVCGTNVEADRLNMEYLDSLPGAACAYPAQRTGRFAVGMVDDVVCLKPGARVIFTANDVERNYYRNGSFGTVVGVGQQGITVDIDGQVRTIFPREWPVNNYRIVGGKLVAKQVGSVRQLPVKLARAITMHRSQGQSFDKAVISPDVFAPGQLYVALSRVRSPDGLRLTRKITPQDLILDLTVQKFYRDGYKWTPKRTAARPAKQSGAAKPAPKSPPAKPAGKAPAAKQSTAAKAGGKLKAGKKTQTKKGK